MPTPNKPSVGPKGGTGSPPKPSTKAASAPEPEPEEEEVQQEEESTETEEADIGGESQGLDFMSMSDEDCDKQVDEAISALQVKFARMRAGPKTMQADATGGLIDEVLLPLLLAVLQWWRNRQKS